ncbi:MlaA family lipoprotein [Neisseria montereyensis]|uniref:VacJ family lipoprotein n=1 Tax=Neisseria montereyensis TaxID=2973938 RepID=A0ABT2FCK3_9NEIS|nr:VacJ family lipoprotein [Neisseria montereyensis]MCS4533938.1 VacJ family lipoprotein [Neisseria montereyensis]
MKKTTTIPLIALSLAIAQPALAESNPADPYEPYNRTMFKINEKADKYIFSPVARGYRKVTPKPVRTGVSNFFNNLRDVVSMGSNLLRLDIKRASEDLVRVGVNTTFGLGGLIDVAGAGGVPNNKNTLGDTFASWGWKNSNYFVYPLAGPSTVRDGIGNTITYAYPVKNAIFETDKARVGTSVLNAVSMREQYLDLTDSLDDAALDKYTYTRDVFMKVRALQTGATLPAGMEDDIDIDDLVDEPSPEAEAPTVDQQEDISADAYKPVSDMTPQSSLAIPEEAQPQALGIWVPDEL